MSLIIKVSKRILLVAVIIVMLFGLVKSGKWILRTVYPFHYRDLVEKYAVVYEVDPYLVAAIIRNESKFNPQAISRREAKGLMQIAPITGEWASEKLDIKDYYEERLYEPELNIEIGIWYLSILEKQFNGKIELMVAAYNAGNGNVSKWLENPEYSIDGQSLIFIPFPETRIYSQKVLRDYERYQVIYEEGFVAFIKLILKPYYNN